MNKKRVGILTFHDADNLGAVLQAFALEKVLKKRCGVSAEIVNYKCKTITDTKYPHKQSGLKGILKSVLLSIYYYIKRRGFDSFRKNNLSCSKKTYSPENIKESENQYELFITGSDQVWNPECSGGDSAYILGFINDPLKKCSYAASIGNFDFSNADSEWVNAIKSFKHISVRENSAAVQLQKAGIQNVSVDVDPVLLLSEEEWKPVMSGRIHKQKYVLVYLILPDVNVIRQAKAYAEKNNCKIISNKHSPEFFLHNSPSDFLSWIYHSECVFTNSFHAAAFSLVFNKPFFADVEMENNKINHRINDLLVLTASKDCSEVKKDCSYSRPFAQDRIEKIKEESMQYLYKICDVF